MSLCPKVASCPFVFIILFSSIPLLFILKLLYLRIYVYIIFIFLRLPTLFLCFRILFPSLISFFSHFSFICFISFLCIVLPARSKPHVSGSGCERGDIFSLQRGPARVEKINSDHMHHLCQKEEPTLPAKLQNRRYISCLPKCGVPRYHLPSFLFLLSLSLSELQSERRNMSASRVISITLLKQSGYFVYLPLFI